MNNSSDKAKLSDSKATEVVYGSQFSRTRQNSVDILFKGIKRKISQRSYSKLKNTYKVKTIQNKASVQPLAISSINRQKLRLTTLQQNKLIDPQMAHQQLLKLKQTNHSLQQQNTQLLRRIRKQQKIQQIYRKKIQGRQLNQMDLTKVLEIKLLLEVENLENIYQEKQKQYQDKLKYIRSKKHSFKDQWVLKKAQIYQHLIDNQEELVKHQKQRNTSLNEKTDRLQNLIEKLTKIKNAKIQKTQQLSQIKKQIKQLNDKFKAVQAESRKNKNGVQLIGLSTLMSSIMTNNQKSGSSKQNSSAILKNNMSSISVKNRNNIEQIQKEIQRIKEECEMINGQIQEYMDEKIKRKLLIHKEIISIQEKQKKQRQIENRNLLCNSSLGKNTCMTLNLQNSSNPLKCSLVIGSN